MIHYRQFFTNIQNHQNKKKIHKSKELITLLHIANLK